MLIALAVFVALYAAVFLALLFGQRKILFWAHAAEVDPATLGLKAKILRLRPKMEKLCSRGASRLRPGAP